MDELTLAVNFGSALLKATPSLHEALNIISKISVAIISYTLLDILKTLKILKAALKKNNQELFLAKASILLKKKRITMQEFTDITEAKQICEKLGCNGLVEQAYSAIRDKFVKQMEV